MKHRYEFIMCNPPFYSSPAEVAQSAEAKEYGPHAVSALRRLVVCSPYYPVLGMYGDRNRNDYTWRRGGIRLSYVLRESSTQKSMQVAVSLGSLKNHVLLIIYIQVVYVHAGQNDITF